jgi:predicted O-methyltransferase YrrM
MAQPTKDSSTATERKWRFPGIKAILRWIIFSPYYLLRLIVMLPVALVRFLIKLPRRIWWLWTQGALLIVKLEKGLAILWHWLGRAVHWRRLHLPLERLTTAAYLYLHPLRLRHGLYRLRDRFNRAAWDRPGLEAVPKALRWARQYRRHKSRFQGIEAVRSILYADDEIIAEEEATLKPTRGYLARRTSLSRRWGALLHGLIRYTETQRVLELGAGYGLASLYMAQGLVDNFPVRTCMLIALEKDRERYKQVYKWVYRLGFDDFVDLREAAIEDELGSALEDIAPLNFALIDGPRDENTVLRTFSQVKSKSRPATLIVLTGIHTSPQMARAWRTIKDMRQVAATVDLWQWGIVVVGSGPAVHLCARL